MSSSNLTQVIFFRDFHHHLQIFGINILAEFSILFNFLDCLRTFDIIVIKSQQASQQKLQTFSDYFSSENVNISQKFVTKICCIFRSRKARTASAGSPSDFFHLLPQGLAARMMLCGSVFRGFEIGFKRCKGA